jgi:glycosyltransferase involved in cell wall biosynthesis
MRVAIVHYWLLGMRGGEKVVESLCRMFPDADIFTLFYDPESISETIRRHRVTASYLNPLRRYHRSLLPFMPSALESLDLRGYDLILSSESGPAKGVVGPSSAHHICYCHTPMRYLWELYPAYLNDWTSSSLKRCFMRPMARNLRMWDFSTAARVDDFVANSRNVQRRIQTAYRRDSIVIHPPVAVESFHYCPAEDYFLMVAEFVPYKRLDYAVRHFAKTGRRLKLVGDGPEYRNLKRLASASIEFCGRVSDEELRRLYAHSRGLIVPGEEDFGITMVEALASGKPVVALGRGGALEIIPTELDGGVLYDTATGEGLAAALERLERREARILPQQLRRYADRFSEAEFQNGMMSLIAQPSPSGAPVVSESSSHDREGVGMFPRRPGAV